MLRASGLRLIFSMRLDRRRNIKSLKSARLKLYFELKARVLLILKENNKGHKMNIHTHMYTRTQIYKHLQISIFSIRYSRIGKFQFSSCNLPASVSQASLNNTIKKLRILMFPHLHLCTPTFFYIIVILKRFWLFVITVVDTFTA